MATVSGQYGAIKIGTSNIVECMNWTFERRVAEHSYASCATNGYKKRIAGTKDGSGTLKGLQDSADVIENYFIEGSQLTIRLYWTAAKYYSCPVQINVLRTEADIDDGSPVPWEADFGANGGWTIN